MKLLDDAIELQAASVAPAVIRPIDGRASALLVSLAPYGLALTPPRAFAEVSKRRPLGQHGVEGR